MTLRNTWLVQRLERPQTFDNPFNFGGGLSNGGLSQDAMSLLRPIFSFAYMGAAEYEFGDVPKTFQKIAENASKNNLKAFTVNILMSKIPPAWGDKTKPERGAKATVYVLAPTDLALEVIERVHEMATGKVDTKGDHNLDRLLRPNPKASYTSRDIGGLEMDNGFIYFTEREAFDKTAALFGVDTKDIP
jgi:hypothetical protein